MASNSQNTHSSRRTIKGYRKLSKQAMKEYAMEQANASSFDWEDEEEM